MNLTPEILLFALFAVASVVSALGVVFLRNPIKGALSLIACFFTLSCLFLLQAAELVAVLEILVYAGAIMVLFVFVIMLVEDHDEPILGSSLGARITLPLKFVGVAVVGFAAVNLVRRSPLAPPAELPEGFGGAAAMGREFFDNYLFHFELTSVLLLVGIVGAVIVSKNWKKGDA